MKKNILLTAAALLTTLAGAAQWQPAGDRIGTEWGEKLDPHKHQAISVVEAEAEANTVVAVMQKGYALADRVLRPAMVMVAKG